MQNGKVEILTNEQGNRITPSYVGWDENGERVVGDAAKNQATLYPEQVRACPISLLCSAKLRIGLSLWNQ